jgi:hypothetical protein
MLDMPPEMLNLRKVAVSDDEVKGIAVLDVIYSLIEVQTSGCMGG